MAVRGKVLIVEDDRAICSFMRRVLEANGYESIIVGTGREALSMLTSHCPDVVILDLGLPDMDGMDVLTQLRAWSLMHFALKPVYWRPMPVPPDVYTLSLIGSRFPTINWSNY